MGNTTAMAGESQSSWEIEMETLRRRVENAGAAVAQGNAMPSAEAVGIFENVRVILTGIQGEFQRVKVTEISQGNLIESQKAQLNFLQENITNLVNAQSQAQSHKGKKSIFESC